MKKVLFVFLVLAPLIMWGKEMPGQEVPLDLWRKTAILGIIPAVSDSGEFANADFFAARNILTFTMQMAASPEEWEKYFSTPTKREKIYQNIATWVFDFLDKKGCLSADSCPADKPDAGL